MLDPTVNPRPFLSVYERSEEWGHHHVRFEKRQLKRSNGPFLDDTEPNDVLDGLLFAGDAF